MFIRWKKRYLRAKDWDKILERHVGLGGFYVTKYGWKDTKDYSLGAYLVESYRNEDGQPRQRNLAYLGSVRIEKEDEGDPQHGYWWIWDKFYSTMDSREVDSATETSLASKISDKLGVLMSRDDIAKKRDEIDGFVIVLRSAFNRR